MPKAYESKQEEFCSYCDFFYHRQSAKLLRYTVTKDKVEAFMMHCLLREHKPRVKRKRGGGGPVLLDYEKANLIVATYAGSEQDELAGKVSQATKDRYKALQPMHGVGYSYLNTTRLPSKRHGHVKGNRGLTATPKMRFSKSTSNGV
jgi:hypothetical protein